MIYTVYKRGISFKIKLKSFLVEAKKSTVFLKYVKNATVQVLLIFKSII